jgi:phage baseplate assembly protein V
LHNLSMSSSSILGQRIPGVVVATVSNIDDPENLGRIKVKLPWMGENHETDWAHVAVPMAGGNSGFFFLPSVDDEVIVAFDRGDINHPFILGSIWNKKAKPPGTSDDAKKNIFRLRTKEGNEILFDDQSSQANRKLEIRTGSGHCIILGSEKIEIKDKNGENSVCIDSQGQSVQIESGNKISIKAPVIEMEATGSMKIKSNTLNVESGGVLDLKATGPMTIQGAIVKIN